MGNLWPFLKLYGKHIGWLSLGILLSVVTLLANLGLLALSGWFITATAVAGLSAVTARAFNFFTPGAGVRGLSIARTAARYGERLVSHDATFRLLSWLRSWFFRKLIPVPMQQLNRYRRGDLLDRLVSDIDALDQLYLRLVSPLLSAVIVTGLLSLFLSFFSRTVAMWTLAIGSSWILLMPLLFYGLGLKSGESLGQRQSRLRQEVLDYLQGMAELQIYGGNAQTRNQLTESERALNKDQQSMAVLEGFGSALFISGSGCAALAVLYWASGEWEAGLVSAPVMAMMVFSMLALFEALMPLPVAFQFLGRTCFAAGRLQEVVSESIKAFTDTHHSSPLPGDISFIGMTCGYDLSQPVIHNVSLSISAGEHIALLGKTGCGKSTLIKLLSREIEPFSGEIMLGGKVITEISEKGLFSTVTFIPQNTHIFSGSLRENLKIAAPLATDGQLQEVINKTGLNQLAANVGENSLLELWIGFGGVKLSGGEQRRVAIARALLKAAPILVMDEPGEGLDEINEQALLKLILSEFDGSTIIMITHKKTALDVMDKVYEMEAGKLQLI